MHSFPFLRADEVFIIGPLRRGNVMIEAKWGWRFIIFFTFFISGCSSSITYQPPIVPIQLSMGFQGVDVSFEVPDLVTPIGTFSLEIGQTVWEFREEQLGNIPRVLLIRVDQQVTVYRLEPGIRIDLDAEYNEVLYRRVRLIYDPHSEDSDIILELETIPIAELPDRYPSVYITDTPISRSTRAPRPTSTPRPTATPNACANSPHRLKQDKKAIVCTWNSGENVILRDGPSVNTREIKRLRPGAVVTIVGPAQCDEVSGWWYWPVRTISGFTGWMAEGGDEKDPYFLCPYP